jgi:hypothetical protein
MISFTNSLKSAWSSAATGSMFAMSTATTPKENKVTMKLSSTAVEMEMSDRCNPMRYSKTSSLLEEEAEMKLVKQQEVTQ